MAPWLGDMFAHQGGLMDVEVWMEPFAGGAGAALTLLDRDMVDHVHLIDQNAGIAAFWSTVVTDGEALAAAVERTTPTMDLFEQSRVALAEADADEFHLGYAAFIVNRCSRSGIIAPRAGAMSDLTARFNAPELADRIRHVASFRSRMTVTRGDGITHIEALDGSVGIEEELVIFCDPPYVREGPRLYAHALDDVLHGRLAAALHATPARWLLTYDDEPVIPEVLYPEHRVVAYDIRNNANRARVAREYAVLSDNLAVGDVSGLSPYGVTSYVRAA